MTPEQEARLDALDWWVERDGVPVRVGVRAFLASIADPSSRRVAESYVSGVRVSTVFMNTPHCPFMDDGSGSHYETMIFGGAHDIGCWRYRTRAEAEAGHARIVGALEGGEEP